LPQGTQRRLGWLVKGLRASRPARPDPRRARSAATVLAANVILLAGWVAVAVAAGPALAARFPRFPFVAPVAVLGLAVAVALPLAWGAYRSYRGLVRSLVGAEAAATATGHARMRLVDAAVTLVLVLLLVPVSLLAPVA